LPPEHPYPVQLDAEQRTQLAHLRHDLRTPINAILGYSEMLIEDLDAAGDSPAALRTQLQAVYATGNLLLSQVNELLDQVKIDHGLDVDLDTYRTNLRRQFLPATSALLSHCEAILQAAQTLDQGALLPDLGKIQAAAQRFSSMLDDLAKVTPQPLTAAPSTAPAQVAASSPEPASNPVGHGGRLLVVDDNEINRDVLSRSLKRQGHLITMAEDGQRALDMLETQQFDLVLLDIMMPRLDGYQVLERMKSRSAWRDIPVIMISALDELDSVAKCIEMGAEEFLSKPFNPVILKARIGACLEKKRLRDKEIEYLAQVELVINAASAVEEERFDSASLDAVAQRTDELGNLARVFQRMGCEVQAREQRLKQQVQALRIQIDDANKDREVAEITENDYFYQLQQEAKRLRKQQP
jgi:CheY-like chemotaxis protein